MLQAPALAAISLGLLVVVYWEPILIYFEIVLLAGCFMVLKLPTGLELASCCVFKLCSYFGFLSLPKMANN